MDCIAISMNSGTDNLPIFIAFFGWFHKRFCASFGGFLPSFCSIFHPKRHHFYAVAVFLDVVKNFLVVFVRHWRGEHQFNFILNQNITGSVGQTSFQSGISQRLKSECCFVIMRCLFGIPHIHFHIISSQ